MPGLDRALSLSLVIAIVAALGCLGYVVAAPKPGEKFTEIYILNTEGRAEDYPRQVKLGEPVAIIIGVVNHEKQPVNYRVDIVIDGIENTQADIGTLADEEKWEQVVGFIPQHSGEGQKVEFWLYRDGDTVPCFDDPLHLYIDVIGP
jgi:uncharacterized membrane protein